MPVYTTLRRHAKSTKIFIGGKKESVVSPASAAESLKQSRRLLRKIRPRQVKVFSSPSNRALVEAFGMNAAAGKRAMKLRAKRNIGLTQIYVKPNSEEVVNEIVKRKYGDSDIKSLNAWLKGETFNGNMFTPERVADAIIRNRFKFALKVRMGATGLGKAGKIKSANLLLDNISHSWIVEAVFQRLTKKGYSTLKPNGMVNENEGLLLKITQPRNGKPRIILKYRNFTGDVTTEFMRIINTPKTKLQAEERRIQKRRTTKS